MSPGARPRVLVVIPTLNEARTIERVLDELHAGLPTSAELRFVVCDGGSVDGTPERVRALAARFPTLALMHNPKRLQSAAVNLAARSCSEEADVLVRCDAHAVYPPGFVARLLDSLDRHGADAVVVPMDSEGQGCLQSAVAWVSDSWLGSGGSAHRGGRRSGFVDHGHHAAFRMASFRRAGGYDESYSHNEDAELDCRQRSLGSRLYLDADIRITYHPRDTWRGLWRQYANYGRGRSRTVRRHPGSWRLRQLAVPFNAVGCATALVAAPVAPWLLAWPAAYAAALLLGSAQQVLKRRSPCAALCGPAAGVMHLAWAWGFIDGLLRLREPRWQAHEQQPLEGHPVASQAGART